MYLSLVNYVGRVKMKSFMSILVPEDFNRGAVFRLN